MNPLIAHVAAELDRLGEAGLVREALLLRSPQGPTITIGDRTIINLTSSDYLGFCNHPDLQRAAIDALRTWGVGLSAARMLAGTLELHRSLEQAVATLIGGEESIVLGSGYEAKVGLFEPLLSQQDYVFADDQIGPGLSDGLRLARARVYPYRSQDLGHLEDLLKRSRAARFRLIVTEGVFPISGLVAQLQPIYQLADRYGAIVVVDDSAGLGVLGGDGGGTHRHLGLSRIDLITGDFGSVLGGGGGGFVCGRRELITWLRQRSRPYLAAPALAPADAAAALAAIGLVRSDPQPREALALNVRLFRDLLAEAGLWIAESEHPSVAVLIRRAGLTQQLVDQLFLNDVLAIGFCPPVVAEGAARVRAQVTALHTQKELNLAADAFTRAVRELGLALER
jgi:glycine C-acetyltransferase